MCSNRVVVVKKMPEKVKLAILDKDLKARTFQKFPLNSDGTKIDVVNSGKGYFMPKIDNDSFIELPRSKFLGGGWDRVYVAVRGAKSCFNFRTGESNGPDPQQVIDAAKAEMIKNFGTDKQETPIWTYVIIGLLILIFLKQFGWII